MTANHDLERRLADHYAREGGVRAPDWVLGNALATIEATSQRRVLVRVPWRFPTMNTNVKVAMAALAVIAVAGIGLAIMRPSGGVGGDGRSLAPSPSPTATPMSLPIVDGLALRAGSYSLNGFPVGLTFTISDGWSACSLSAVEQGICRQAPSAAANVVGVAFLDVVNVAASQCSTTLLDPAVGPTVEDLVTAISGMEGLSVSTPQDVSVDGYPGKVLTVAAPETMPESCDLATWATAGRVNGIGVDEINEVRIVDVDGERIFIAMAYFNTHSADVRASLRQVVDTIQLEP